MSADKLTSFKQSKLLAHQARKIAGKRDVLYYGTRQASSILNMGIILRSDVGNLAVSFSRSPDIAAHMALLLRDPDEGRGAIFIFDRQSLRHRYRIEPFHDPIWDTETHCNDEMEERIRKNVIDIGSHLVGLVTTPYISRSPKQRQENRGYRLKLSGLHDQARNRVSAGTSKSAFSRELAKYRRIEREQQEKLRRLFPEWTKACALRRG